MTKPTPRPQAADTSVIGGVHIHRLTLAELLNSVTDMLRDKTRAEIVNVNVQALNLAAQDPWFRDILNRATLAFCDGYGVKWAAAFLGKPLPERFTPPDWLEQFCVRCRDQQAGIFLLGAKPGVAEQAGAVLSARVPGLILSGTQHGFFNKSPDHAENRAVVATVNRSGARVLLVGFGMPLQEQWLWENRDQLEPGIALTVGAALDYVAGTVPRAPRWMTDAGLEWLGRLCIEPRRLWKRYLLGNPRFVLRVIRERLHRRVPRGPA